MLTSYFLPLGKIKYEQKCERFYRIHHGPFKFPVVQSTIWSNVKMTSLQFNVARFFQNGVNR